MPTGSDGKLGDLFLGFEVEFPEHINREAKLLLRIALGDEDSSIDEAISAMRIKKRDDQDANPVNVGDPKAAASRIVHVLCEPAPCQPPTARM
jgi:hypothetical protein